LLQQNAVVCPASQRKISWQTLKVESDTLPQVNSGSESNMSATSSYGHGHGAVSDRDNDSISSTQDLQPDRSRKSKKRKAADEPATRKNAAKKTNPYTDSPSKRSQSSQNYQIPRSPSSHSNNHIGGIPSLMSKRPQVSNMAMKGKVDNKRENKDSQTDMKLGDIATLQTTSNNRQNESSRIEEARLQNTRLQLQLTNFRNEISENKKRSAVCVLFIQKLLVQNSKKEKEEARKKAMEERLRLGQFKLRGTGYGETWENGWAFASIALKKTKISDELSEINHERNALKKRKPITTVKGNTKTEQAKEHWTPFEFHERDEILKQRSLAVKRDETDLQFELDRLERQRSLHIRELKRIANEDNSQFNNFPVLNKRYLLLTMLGKGGFSEVYKGFDLDYQKYVAVKIHHLNQTWNEQKKVDYARHANRESEIHRKVKHARIVGLYDRFEVDINTFCTVLEYCEGNDLDFYLKQHKTINEKEARTVIMQVVSALYYLNSLPRPVIHYDLKPGNILLCNGNVCGNIKITDFGLSKQMDDGLNPDEGMELTSQGAGTYWYLPPECFARMPGGMPPKIDNKVDVWSVGVIFYQCLYGRKPFGHNQTQDAILKNDTILNANEVTFPNKPAISLECKSFIKGCLAYYKDKRSDVFQLYAHPYLQPPPTRSRANAANQNGARFSHA